MSVIGTALTFELVFPKDCDILEFSVPIQDSGVKIMPPEYLMQDIKPPYFGNTVDLKFWSLLGIPFGSTPNPSNPLTRVDNYKYIYNHTKKTFDAYDDNNVNFVSIKNVSSIADMNIDFTIFNSGQFQILIEEFVYQKQFIFPATIERGNLIPEIQNISHVDTNSRYINTKYISEIEDGFANEQYYMVSYNYSISNVNKFNGIDWNKCLPVVYFYTHGLYNIAVRKVYEEFYAKSFELLPVIPCLSVNMFPTLMPIIRAGETVNNRPIYEPWLISILFYDIFKRLNHIKPDDPYDPDAPTDPKEREDYFFDFDTANIFDLSPTW